MLTRSGGNPRRRRDAAAGTIKLLEKRLETMEIKEELTKSDIQSVVRVSKLLGDVSNDFKTYHFAIVDQLENDEDAEAEQETLDQHELKVMGLIDRIAELIGEPLQAVPGSNDDLLADPQPSIPALVSTNDRLVDRHLDLLGDSVQGIKRAVENPDCVDAHLLISYQDKVRSLEKSCKGSRKTYCLLRRSENACERRPISTQIYSIYEWPFRD